MFASSDGGCVKTPRSDAQTADDSMADNVKKRSRYEDPLCKLEMILQEKKDSLIKSYNRKGANLKDQNEEIQILKATIDDQKAEINRLTSQIKNVEFSFQYEINQRKDVNNKNEKLTKRIKMLQDHTVKLAEVLQKCLDDRQKVSVWYKQFEEMKDQSKNDQKYQADLYNVQKQLELEQQHHSELINKLNDKNSKTDQFIDYLKNKISSLEEAIQDLKLKEDKSAIREKQNQEEILNLSMLIKQKEQDILIMQSDFKRNYDNISKEKKDLSESFTENKKRVSLLEDELEELKITSKEQDAESKKFREEFLDLNEKIDALKKEAEENHQFYEKNVNNLQMSIDSLENLNSTLTNVKIELEEEISSLKQELEENKTFIQEKCDEKYFLQKKVKDLEEEIETLKKEKENVETSLDIEFATKLKVATSSHDEDIKKYESRISNLQDELEAKSKRIIELVSEVKLTIAKLNGCESNLENTTGQLESLNEELRILNDTYNRQIVELKEKLTNTENMYVSVVNELKALKESTNKPITKLNLNLNADIFTRRSNIIDLQREKVTTTRNSPKKVENNEANKEAVTPNLKTSLLNIDLFSNDSGKSFTRSKVFKKDKKKVSATQKETVTSTNGATPKASGKFSKPNKRALFNI